MTTRSETAAPPGPTDNSVRAALRGLAVVPDWLAAPRQSDNVRAALLRDVPELAAGEVQLTDVVTERLRAKGGRWLAQYQVSLGANDGSNPRQVTLAGELFPPTALATADQCDVRFGEPGWHGFLPKLGLRLEVQGADNRLPMLPQLVDPEAARILLQRCLYEGGYSQAQVVACKPTVVRYEPGSRCTVVYGMRYAGEPDGLPDPVVLKTHWGEKGRTAYEAMRALWDTPLSSGRVLTLAEPLAYVPELKVLAQGPVPEDRTLKDLAREAFAGGTPAALGDLRTGLRRTADGLAALHRCGAEPGPAFTWGEELVKVRDAAAGLAASIPAAGSAAEPLIAGLSALAGRVPVDPAATSHGTFRPAQVLLHGDRIGFIDFDGACVAEPAFDIGRFRATLRDIGVSAPAPGGGPLEGQRFDERMAILDQLCEEFLDRYRMAAAVTPDRVLLWEATDLLTLLLHAWSKVRLARVQPRLSLLTYYLGTMRFPAGIGTG